MIALFHLDTHVVLEHCPQVLCACNSNVNFQGWIPLNTHFLAVLPSLTHSDNLMTWNTIAFRSSILYYTFVLKTVFELRVCQQKQPKECGCCYKVSFSEAVGRRYWHSVKQSPRAAEPFMGNESAAVTTQNTKYGNPLMGKIIGTHAPSESTGERKYFIFHTFVEENWDRSLKLRCLCMCSCVCVCVCVCVRI